jgi:hypothetical protein
LPAGIQKVEAQAEPWREIDEYARGSQQTFSYPEDYREIEDQYSIIKPAAEKHPPNYVWNSSFGLPVLVARGKSILIIWTSKSDFPTFKAGRIKASAVQ